MRNDLERYVIEVNGIAKAEYPIFMKALKASLQLRQELPKCRIKLRDAGDETSHQLTSLSPKVCKLVAISCGSYRFRANGVFKVGFSLRRF